MRRVLLHFILISKKDSFKDQDINENLLGSSNAPSLISREAIKYEISNFILYIYPYNHLDHETEGYSYNMDEDKLLLINGIINVDNNLRDKDINNFFKKLSDSSKLLGDYQLISIDKKGNGYVKTSPLSIRQLFHYEDENCTVLSTEIKLIVDGVTKFKENKFVDHFDPDFVEDAVYREWGPRKFPKKTIFQEIKRIFPYDNKYFSNGKIVIESKNKVQVPQWFREAYNENKDKLFDDYYQFLINFTETNLVHLKPNIDKITLGLTGGFDSRLAVAILSKICNKHQIPFECQTSGQEDHPDVVIAKKIAKIVDVKYVNNKPPENIRPNTKDYGDYISTFYISQGDFNSKDSVLVYKRKILNLNVLQQLGNSGYKKDNMYRIYFVNIWYARRILFHKNFYFPLFFTNYEMWFALLYAEIKNKDFKEFVYEILKRSNPKLLEIPFVGDSLPQTDVKPYLTIRDSKHHEKEPFLWDYNYVRTNLKPVFIKKFNNSLGLKSKIIFKIARLNELDYFLNPELDSILQSYRKNQIDLQTSIKMLLKEGKSDKYPKTKVMIEMTKDSRTDPFISKMQILMDFASVTDKYSFNEMEEELTFSN